MVKILNFYFFIFPVKYRKAGILPLAKLFNGVNSPYPSLHAERKQIVNFKFLPFKVY